MKWRSRRWVVAPYVITTALVGFLTNVLSGAGALLWPLVVLTVGAVILLIALENARDGNGKAPYRTGGRLNPAGIPLVARRDEVDEVVRHLLAPGKSSGQRRGGAISTVTGIHGPGGFGKTTVADIVGDDPRVRRRFKERIAVTLGADVPDADLAAKLNDLAESLTGVRPGFVRPDEAGNHLGAILDQRGPTLLIIDDVWHAHHLLPFLKGGRDCVRLVTTRKPDVLPVNANRVRVDQMTLDEARHLIEMDVAKLPRDTVDALVQACGHWPLLLALVSGRLRNAERAGANLRAAADEILSTMRSGGPAALDVRTSTDRSRAVRTNVRLSTDRLPPGGVDRFLELSIFAKDEPIPIPVIAVLWRQTGGLALKATRDLLESMVELSLVRYRTTDTVGTGVMLHGVIRTFLCQELGPDGLIRVNAALVERIDHDLGGERAWWRLRAHDQYLWRHLPEHLAAAGADRELAALVTDLRWVSAKLRELGPEAVAVDLAAVDGGRAASLLHTLTQSAHLLSPTDPPESVADILLSRLRDQPQWTEEVASAAAAVSARLCAVWPMPDTFDPAMVRVLGGIAPPGATVLSVSPGQTLIAAADNDSVVHLWDAPQHRGRPSVRTGMGQLTCVAVAPDDAWFATAGEGRAIGVWDTATGGRLATLEGHTSSVHAIVIAPHGRWLASTSADRTVRVWDTTTWQCRQTLAGHHAQVRAAAASPAGTLLATHSEDRTIRIWDLTDGTHWTLATGVAHVHALSFTEDGDALIVVSTVMPRVSVAVWNLADRRCRIDFPLPAQASLPATLSPDGEWIAAACGDHLVRLWNIETSKCIATFTGHPSATTALVATGRRSLLTATVDGYLCVWDAAPRIESSPSVEHLEAAWSVATAPDGAWFATGLDNHGVKIWDLATRTARTLSDGHTGHVLALAASADGVLLASGGADRTVRVWNVASGHEVCPPRTHPGQIYAIATAPDSRWLATGGFDGVIRIWPTPSDPPVRTLTTGTDVVAALAASADGTALASAGGDRCVTVWDTATWQPRCRLDAHTDWVRTVALSPDGRLAASAGLDHDIIVWDITGAKPETRLRGHHGDVNSVAFSADNSYLASVGDDQEIRVWDVRRRTCTALMRVTSAVRACVWLGGTARRTLVAVGAGGTYVFDLRDGARLNS
jgi:WD40 repeat protein